MGTVSISELQRHASSVVGEVENTGRPAIVTNHGRPVAALIPLAEGDLEDLVLATAPNYLAAMREAEADHRAGRTRTAAEVFAELDATPTPKRRITVGPGMVGRQAANPRKPAAARKATARKARKAESPAKPKHKVAG